MKGRSFAFFKEEMLEKQNEVQSPKDSVVPPPKSLQEQKILL